MLAPIQKALLPGAIAASLLFAPAASGKDVYKPYLDKAIPHHAAILDTLEKLEKSPDDAQLHNDLGCLVAWDGFWRDALRSFAEASDLDPKDSRPWFNAGLVQALRGEWGAARSRFRKAVKADPGNWTAWWMLGFAEETLGHENAAVEAYSRSLRVDTSLFDPRVNPFAVATRLKSRVLLRTYERRRVDAALPFSNQLSDVSRLASFFQQARPVPAKGAARAAESPQSGPVVTAVPSTTVLPETASEPSTRPARRRRAYPRGSDPSEPVELQPEPPRQEPAAAEPKPEGGDAPRVPGPGGGGPGLGSGARRVPGPGGAPPVEPTPEPK
ncbi:MAG: tetratricopeptide repeat protein [Thermoanaerobaculia bacterium]